MAARQVVIVRTGVANLASVVAALHRCGAEPMPTTSRSAIATADHVVLPGVGSFAAAMKGLSDHGLVEPLRQRLNDARPTLAVCLGMQLLAAASEESPGVRGLGVIADTVRRLSEADGKLSDRRAEERLDVGTTRPLRVPHLGWNEVEPGRGGRWLQPGFAYFANSYALRDCPGGEWRCAWTDYGGRWVAALERPGLLACQFHPELSSGWGRALIRRWLDLPESAGAAQ